MVVSQVERCGLSAGSSGTYYYDNESMDSGKELEKSKMLECILACYLSFMLLIS